MRLAVGILFLVASCYCLPSEDVHLSEEEFEEKFHIKVNDPVEKQKEAETLEKAEKEINEINKEFEEGKSTYTEELNEYSNMPLEEFEKEREGAKMPKDVQRALGAIMPPEHIQNDPENAARMNEVYRQIEMERQAVPDSYDSTEQGLVTPVKNQKSCGSCAAFAAHGLHETCLRKAGVPMKGLDLSEQYLIDCGYNGRSMNACNGAYPHSYPVWFANNGGLSAHEGKYPYLDTSPLQNCAKAKGLEWQAGAKVDKAYYDFGSNESKMKSLLVKYGAIAIALYASDRGFNNYKGGVFDGCTSEEINHAVLLVGYGTENGVPYWKVKNSWGPNWGDKGFIKIKRGENQCGMEKFHVVTSCTKSGESEPAPPATTPKPVPANLKCDISGIYGTGITGDYQFRTTVNGKEYVSKVSCENSICTPLNPGPSNACMYICGMLQCTRSKPTVPTAPTTPAVPTTTASEATTVTSTCNVAKLIGLKRYKGKIIVPMLNDDGSTKYVVSNCKKSVCTLEVPAGRKACEFFCGNYGDKC